MLGWLTPYRLTLAGDWLLLLVAALVYCRAVQQNLLAAPLLATAQVALLAFAKAYRANLKYLNLFLLRDLTLVALAGAAAAGGLEFFRKNFLWAEPTALFFAQTALLFFHRLVWYFRLNPESRVKKQGLTPVVIYGAGTVAYHLLQDLSTEDLLGRYQIAAIVDNDPQKVGSHLGPYRVFAGKELARIVERQQVKEVWFTMPVTPDFLKQVMDELAGLSVVYKVIPRKLAQFAPDIRNVRIEDLVRRPEIRLDAAPLERAISGKRVLVTGAAGSIGQELARQLYALSPSRLTLIDQWEYGVYRLEQEFQSDNVFCAVADVRNERRLYNIIVAEKPHFIFHAAAYKHVPLMEINYLEAIDTNILGTWYLLRAALGYARTLADGDCVRLVNISTDKAVQPENIMGLTKRVAELLVFNAAQESQHKLRTASVRFGNVLGSSGSVVPLFWEQIQRGGPVTVTHPEMERFFMTIPEAVRLVLHAAVLESESDCIYALDMGKPVRIAELAERLILLAGKKPHTEIPIVFTGVRPGEKLKEELFWEKNSVRTDIPFIFRSTAELRQFSAHEFISLLLSALAENHSRSWYQEFLKRYA
ncbi:MAG: polysaccharide biosynthesis protein [Leptospiraceae bacterium]|nr:polysaccharide biosynthesis protein [Leptospiraceae bacterium]